MKTKTKKLLISLILIIPILVLLSYISGPSKANVGEVFLNGMAGILLLPAHYGMIIIGSIISLILGLLSGNGASLSIEDILFNKGFGLTDINFFDFSATGTVLEIRQNIAIWYTSIRNLAAIILAVIAVYVGIRMALSTIAEDKAKYKSMLIDWITSLALLFVLQYIMLFIININNTLVGLLAKGLPNNSANMANITDVIFNNAMNNPFSFTEGVGNAIAYLLLEGITLIFLLTYIKRMVTLAFLIVISPLVTVTYSIDKMGDGKSQALNVWLKEFSYNILIQPFHCIAYLALGTSAMNMLSPDNGTIGLGYLCVAIFMLMFIYKSEDIIKHIFHFESASMGSTVAQAALTTAMLSKVGNAGKSIANKSAGKASIAEKNRMKNNTQQTNRTIPRTKENETNANNMNLEGQSKTEQRNNVNNNEEQQQATIGNSNNDSSQAPNNKNSRRNAFLKGVKKVGGAYMALNARALGLGTIGALGGATGDIKTMIAGATGGFALGSAASQSASTSIKQHNVAKAYNNYVSSLREKGINLTDDQLLENSLDILNDPTKAKTDEELSLRESMREMQKRYSQNGMNDEENEKKMKKTVKAVQSGEIGEHTTAVRLTMDGKNRFEELHKKREEKRNKNA